MRSSLSPLDSLSLTEQAIEKVRNALADGSLVPGQLYSVIQLADRLGVSRSPVRDALLRLAETGLIRFERNRGFRVVIPTPHEVAEMIAVRMALEVPAARRAAAHGTASGRAVMHGQYSRMHKAVLAGDERGYALQDQAFHELILELAENSYVKRMIGNLRDATRLLWASTITPERTLLDACLEHSSIADAIDEGDSESAGKAMQDHLELTGRLLLLECVRQSGNQVSEQELWDRLIG